MNIKPQKKGETLTNINFSRRIHKRSLLWIGLAFLVVLMSDLLPTSFFDRWYYQGIFAWIRVTYDTLLGWSPVPMIYIVFVIILVRIAQWTGEWEKGVSYQVTKSIGGLAFLIILFYILWGFNYNQVPLQTRLGFDLEEVSQSDIEVEFQRATEELKRVAAELPVRLTSDESIVGLKISDNDLRPDVEKALDDLGIPNNGRVRVRQLWPAGFLLRWGTAGIYIPQAFEGHIDKGLLSVQKPFTIAHEMAHGYGVTDEGACNFIAWLACSQSRDSWVRFGGAFTYWRYTSAEIPEETVADVLHTSSPVILRSLALIRENDKKYPDLMPKVRDAIYSSYLKRHGVKGGLKSYNYVVMMVQQYLEKNPEKSENSAE